MSPGVLNCLGTVTDLLISFVFLIFHDFLCVDMLDRSSLHFFSIWFLAGFFFGIQYLAFGFWHLLLAYSVKHFVSISSVIFWHLYSTHTFHQRLGSFPSLPEAVRVRIEWVSEWVRDRVPFECLQKPMARLRHPWAKNDNSCNLVILFCFNLLDCNTQLLNDLAISDSGQKGMFDGDICLVRAS